MVVAVGLEVSSFKKAERAVHAALDGPEKAKSAASLDRTVGDTNRLDQVADADRSLPHDLGQPITRRRGRQPHGPVDEVALGSLAAALRKQSSKWQPGRTATYWSAGDGLA